MGGDHVPEPRLALVYHLEAALGEPLDLGEGPVPGRMTATRQPDVVITGADRGIGADLAAVVCVRR